MGKVKPSLISREQLAVGAIVAFALVLIAFAGFFYLPVPGPIKPDCASLVGERLKNIAEQKSDSLVIPQECAQLFPGGTIQPSYTPKNSAAPTH